jgi:transposase
MATYFQYQPKNYDNFKTPIEVWDNIKHLIPKDKKIWCPFWFEGEHTLKELGYDIIHENEDFFKNNKGDLIIDNPPFGIKKKVLEYCLKIDKPFILIMPSSTINYQYFREFKNKIQIIIPPKRYNFMKDKKSSATFDTLYYCYKMNFNKDIIWLD